MEKHAYQSYPNIDESVQFMGSAKHIAQFKERIQLDKEVQKELELEQERRPFDPYSGCLVFRFQDNTYMQTNWTKLSTALEKMRTDGSYVVALIQLKPSQVEVKISPGIVGGIRPVEERKEKPVRIYAQTRMLSAQNGRNV